MDPLVRLTCDELLDHPWFDGFREWFHPELEVSITVLFANSNYMIVILEIVHCGQQCSKSKNNFLSLSPDFAGTRSKETIKIKVQSSGMKVYEYECNPLLSVTLYSFTLCLSLQSRRSHGGGMSTQPVQEATSMRTLPQLTAIPEQRHHDHSSTACTLTLLLLLT